MEKLLLHPGKGLKTVKAELLDMEEANRFVGNIFTNI